MKLHAASCFRPLACAAALLTVCATLSACAPLVLGGAAAAGTAVVITDRRSSGTQLDDKNTGFKIESEVRKALGEGADVTAHVYNGKALLTGNTPDAQSRQKAATIAQGVLKVKSVVNYITVGPVQTLSSRTNDTWLTSKVKSTLIRTKYVPSNTIDVTTNRGTVFLMGLVTENEGRYAAQAAAGVGGVSRVVKVFEILTRDEAIRLSGAEAGDDDKDSPKAEQRAAPIESGAESVNAPASTDSGTGGGAVEVMPIR